MARIPTTVTTFHSKEAQGKAVSKLRFFVSGFKKQPVQTQVEEAPVKKYVHVPTEAAAGFLRTATPHHMKKDERRAAFPSNRAPSGLIPAILASELHQTRAAEDSGHAFTKPWRRLFMVHQGPGGIGISCRGQEDLQHQKWMRRNHRFHNLFLLLSMW
ncbi:hypothetical protein SUNI508_13627 [Seiridium unicorne]|uniref:Uncharacterized protein n=1 Tax=Seiridium unicorne TaxID=138068 RepID=A0ABR2VC09_9PEZI